MRKLSMLSVAHLAIATSQQGAVEVRQAVGPDEINFRNLTYRYDKPKQNWQGQGKRKKPRVR